MTMAHQARRLIFFLLASILFVPLFIYALVARLTGKLRYTRRDHARDFGHGYKPPSHWQASDSPDPKSPEVWAHALERTWKAFGRDPRLAALMGMVYRFQEPETVDECDRILDEHIFWLRRENEGETGNPGDRIWNPVSIVKFMDDCLSRNGIKGFKHFYIGKSRSLMARGGLQDPGDWSIIKFGKTSFRKTTTHAPIEYYTHTYTLAPVFLVEYAFYGDKDTIFGFRFRRSSDVGASGTALGALCKFAMDFFSGMMDENDAALLVSRLHVSRPEPFECTVGSARIKFEYHISKPYWSEPEQFFVSLVAEKV